MLEAWTEGLTVGEAYQRLLNALIGMSRLSPTNLALPDGANTRAVMQRNELLYALIGDPALQPFTKTRK